MLTAIARERDDDELVDVPGRRRGPSAAAHDHAPRRRSAADVGDARLGADRRRARRARRPAADALRRPDAVLPGAARPALRPAAPRRRRAGRGRPPDQRPRARRAPGDRAAQPGEDDQRARRPRLGGGDDLAGDRAARPAPHLLRARRAARPPVVSDQGVARRAAAADRRVPQALVRSGRPRLGRGPRVGRPSTCCSPPTATPTMP